MNEPPQNDLLYGHLGEANYDTDTKEWRFSRKLGSGRLVKPLGTSRTTLSATLSNPSTSIQDAVARKKNITYIASANPTLVAAADTLPSLAQVSEVINETVSTYDPTVGELLSFGKARDLNRGKSRRFIDIAAAAGGPGEEILRLVRVGKKRFECQGNVWAHVDVPTLEKGEFGYWIGTGSPILQVCFSTDVHILGSFLAVRSATLITIFRPLIQRWPVPPRSNSLSLPLPTSYPSSTLDANPFLFLSTELAGGVSFADVSFNPWNEHQFAVIDHHGCWSIWNIGREAKDRGPPALKVGSSGDLRNVLQKHPDSGLRNFNEDGWGLVLWAGNPNTILIANRRVLLLYDIKAVPEMFNLNLVPEADWVLDVKRDARNPFLVCVLTSTRLIWLHVRTDIVEYAEGDFTRVLLSWKHFRNYADTSLRLSLHSENSVTTVLVYSRLSNLATTYTFSISADGIPRSLADPFIWPAIDASDESGSKPLNSEAVNQRLSSNTIVMRTGDGFISPSFVAPEWETARIYQGSRFYQLFSLQSDLSLLERVYYESVGQTPKVNLQAGKSKTLGFMTPRRVTRDDFIVDDGLESEDETVPMSSYRGSGKSRGEDFDFKEDPRTVNMGWLADLIESIRLRGRQGEVRDDGGIANMNLEDRLEQLRIEIMSNSEDSSQGIKTLYELVEKSAHVDDLEDTTNILKTFIEDIVDLNFSNDRESSPVQIKELLIPGSLSFSTLSDLGDSDISKLLVYYDALVKRWITPLSSKVPARIRVNLSRCLKDVALQLCMTSYGLQKISTEIVNLQTAEGEDNNRNQLTLTVRRKISSGSISSKGKARSVDGSRPSQQTSLPLPGNSLLTPTRSSSTHSEASASSLIRTEDQACQRLQSLAHSNTPPPLSETANGSLAHWQLGANPADYDWEATSRALQASESEDEETARKRKKNAKKRSKEQRKLDLLSSQSVQPLLSSQFDSAAKLPFSSRRAEPSSEFFTSQSIGTQLLESDTTKKVPKKLVKKRKKGF